MHSRTAHRTERIPLSNWLVGLLIYGPEVRVGGERFAPGPVDGAFSLPAPAPSGYVWTYLGEGTDFCDAPDLVVVVPGYEAPHRWTEHLLTLARRDLAELVPSHDRVMPVSTVSLAPQISFEVPVYPTHASRLAFRGWCEWVGRDLLLIGGMRPNGCEALLYAGPLSHPMTWETPGPTGPLKTFGRDAQ